MNGSQHSTGDLGTATGRRAQDSQVYISGSDRALAAVSYVGPGFLAPILMGTHTPFVRWHAAQGFVLFFLEALGLAGLVMLDATIGRIPLLGLVVMLVARAGLLTGFVVVAAIGAVKAAAGERFAIPWLERYARRLPLVEHGGD